MIRTGRALLGAGAAAAILLAAGCTSGKHTERTSSSAPAPATGSPALVQNRPPSSIANVPAKRPDVKITECAAVAGGWSASGTAQNLGKSRQTYAITIFFTTTGGTVQDYSSAKLTVDGGKTGTWTAKKSFVAQQPTQCVLRGVG